MFAMVRWPGAADAGLFVYDYPSAGNCEFYFILVKGSVKLSIVGGQVEIDTGRLAKEIES